MNQTKHLPPIRKNRIQILWTLAIAGLLLFSPNGRASEWRHLTKEVAGTGKRSCRAHLYLPEKSASYPLILNLTGNGIYTVENFGLTRSVSIFLDEAKAAVLMIDKPGLKHLNSKDRISGNE